LQVLLKKALWLQFISFYYVSLYFGWTHDISYGATLCMYFHLKVTVHNI